MPLCNRIELFGLVPKSHLVFFWHKLTFWFLSLKPTELIAKFFYEKKKIDVNFLPEYFFSYKECPTVYLKLFPITCKKECHLFFHHCIGCVSVICLSLNKIKEMMV